MSQLELAFHAPWSVHALTSAYLARRCDGLSEWTVRDYGERARWLDDALGANTDARTLTLEAIEDLVARWGPHGKGLMLVTIKRRLVWFRACLKYGAARRAIEREHVFDLPRIRNDGRRKREYLTLPQHGHLVLSLAPGRYRRFAEMAFWTGMHTYDLVRTTFAHLDPDHEFRNSNGEVMRRGGFFRRNHKNPHCAPVWFPAEPEFVEIMRRWHGERAEAAGDEKVIGPLFSLSKAFAVACDRACLPRVRPNLDMRASYATLLESRRYLPGYIRVGLGHQASDSHIQGGESTRPTTLETHYLHASVDLLAHGKK